MKRMLQILIGLVFVLGGLSAHAAEEEKAGQEIKKEEESQKSKVPLLTLIDQSLGEGIREAVKPEDSNDVLKNIDSFSLMIILDDFGFNTKSVISEQELRTKAELNLRRNGIKLQQVQGFSILIMVQVMPLQGNNPTQPAAYVFRTDLKILNDVYLPNPSDGDFTKKPAFSRVLGTLYFQGGAGFAPGSPNGLRTAVAEMVIQNIEQFCNDYLSKNPDKLRLPPSEKRPPEEKPISKKQSQKK